MYQIPTRGTQSLCCLRASAVCYQCSPLCIDDYKYNGSLWNKLLPQFYMECSEPWYRQAPFMGESEYILDNFDTAHVHV